MDIKDILIPESAIEAIDEGQWVDDIIGAPGLKLKVRGFSSRKVQNFRDARLRRVPRKDRDQAGNVSPEVLREISRETIIEVVLLDWNLKQNGQPIPCTKEMVRKLITPATGDRLVGYITDAAMLVDDLQNGPVEDIEKN